MTAREYFNAILKLDNLPADLAAETEKAIARLDKRNEQRKDKPSKTQTANEPIKIAILELLSGGAMVASDIGRALNISTQKASSLCHQLVAEKKATVADIKVKGKGTVKQYSVPSAK